MGDPSTQNDPFPFGQNFQHIETLGLETEHNIHHVITDGDLNGTSSSSPLISQMRNYGLERSRNMVISFKDGQGSLRWIHWFGACLH